MPALAKANDTSQSIEWRVRSYFAANCVQCHQPGGQSHANWDARPTTPTDSAQMINGILNYVSDDPANRFVVPGDVDHSMALKRLLGTKFRMPPLATNELVQSDPAHSRIGLRNRCLQRQSFTQWQIQYFGATDNPNAAATADPDRDGQNNLEEYFAYSDPTRANSGLPPIQGTRGGGSRVPLHPTGQSSGRGRNQHRSDELEFVRRSGQPAKLSSCRADPRDQRAAATECASRISPAPLGTVGRDHVLSTSAPPQLMS